MAILENIFVGTNQLKEVCPDIESIMFPTQIDFSGAVNEAKRRVFGLIKIDYKKRNPTYSDEQLKSDLEKVKDYDDEIYLQEKISKYAVAVIFRQNRMFEEMAIYEQEAKEIPLMYFVDLDEDEIIDQEEEIEAKKYPALGR